MTTYSSDLLIKYFSTASKIICATFFICYYLLVQDDSLYVLGFTIPYSYFAGFIGGALTTTWIVTLILQILSI